LEVAARVPIPSTPGRSIVSRRAVVDIIRTATLGSYGVTGFAGGIVSQVFARFGLVQPGIRVTFGQSDGAAASYGEEVEIELDLDVAHGVPVAEVARQVDSAVRYAIRRALDREVRRLTIHVDGLRYRPGDLPTAVPAPDPDAVGIDALVASGTDVA
jgi:uncharacterized alkaline shock family protein YloU